jgi:hypothetical protein
MYLGNHLPYNHDISGQTSLTEAQAFKILLPQRSDMVIGKLTLLHTKTWQLLVWHV